MKKEDFYKMYQKALEKFKGDVEDNFQKQLEEMDRQKAEALERGDELFKNHYEKLEPLRKYSGTWFLTRRYDYFNFNDYKENFFYAKDGNVAFEMIVILDSFETPFIVYQYMNGEFLMVDAEESMTGWIHGHTYGRKGFSLNLDDMKRDLEAEELVNKEGINLERADEGDDVFGIIVHKKHMDKKFPWIKESQKFDMLDE